MRFRTPFLVGAMILATSTLFAQTAPFERYRFEDGGYTFVGVFSHHNDHPLQKKVGEFYITDISALNSLKKAWRFSRPQGDYACGYHYQFLVLRKGEKLDSFVVNLDCNQLRTADQSLYFPLKKLESLTPYVKKLTKEYKEFANVAEARAHLQTAKTLPSFAYAKPPRWSEFEGEFQFNMKCPVPSSDCYREFEKLKPALEREISSKYPGEKFSLEESGGSSDGHVFVKVRSNKSLEERFDIYDRWGRTAFGRWEAYYPDLLIYYFSAP